MPTDASRQIAAILGLIVTMLGGALAVSYMSAYVMVLFGVAMFAYALFAPRKDAERSAEAK
jgi:hypothetical protein